MNWVEIATCVVNFATVAAFAAVAIFTLRNM